MRHRTVKPADLAPPGAIFALRHGMASAILAELMPCDKVLGEALDRAYGAGKWFMFWDEDLSGKPIRGTISLAYGDQTLVIG